MNIETALIEYLKECGFDAYANVPVERPEEFVTVERTGGSHDAVAIDRPVVAIQCWASSRLDASILSYNVNSAMLRCDAEGVMKVSCNSLYNFPDGESGMSRYQAVYDIVTN